MITLPLSKSSSRARLQVYNLLSPAGRNQIAGLLTAEIEVAKQFELSYETPELRKLAMQVKRGTATEQEVAFLEKSKKSFQGRLVDGRVVSDPKAVELINKYLEVVEIAQEDLKALSGSAKGEGTSTEIILGNQISYWNLHPDQFNLAVFNAIYDSPEYVKSELEKIIGMKTGTGSTIVQGKLYDSKKEVDALVRLVPCSANEHASLTRKVLKLQPVGNIPAEEFKAIFERALKTFIEFDLALDMELYKVVKDYLPQYHNQHARYFIHLLSRFNFVQETTINSRISLKQLHAFYRKADELCYS